MNSNNNNGITKPKRTCKRKAISLETKMKILDCLGSGLGSTKVGKKFGYRESTIRMIQKCESAIRKSACAAEKFPSAMKLSYTRNTNIEQMENLLSNWIDDRNQKHIPLDTNAIKQKAKHLYEMVIQEPRSVSTADQSRKFQFSASGGWFSKFIQRYGYRNLKITDVNAAKVYAPELQQIITDGGYTSDQVFNANETGLFWKQLPTRSLLADSKKPPVNYHHRYRGTNDRVTFLLCCNASGDRILKPLLVNKSSQPRVLKNCDMSRLPVHWMANKRAEITEDVFKEWFETYFVTEVESYLMTKKLPFKVILIIDKAHDNSLLVHENIRVLYIPRNTNNSTPPTTTTTILSGGIAQPLDDHGIISTFKINYIKKVFESITNKLDSNSELNFVDVWRDYNILDCVEHAASAISEINRSTLNACWRSLWPECVIDGGGGDVVVSDSDDVSVVKDNKGTLTEIMHLANCMYEEEFSDIKCEDINEMIRDPIINDDDADVDVAVDGDHDNDNDNDNDDDDDDEDEDEVTLISNKITDSEDSDSVSMGLETIESGLQIATRLETYFLANDPDTERLRQFQMNLQNCLAPYKELYKNVLRRKDGNQASSLTNCMINID